MTDSDVSTTQLSAMDRVELARHKGRPHSSDYINHLVEEFVELHGDRHKGDDQALIGGIGTFAGYTVMVLGQQKGANTQENIKRHFGMMRPEGYRKVVRLALQAEKFGMVVICFIDTPGAEPDIEAEKGGQAIAIAECLQTFLQLETITVSVVIGEGGSGGALAIGATDRILMLENTVYSVASPEASASILWKDAKKAAAAAEAMKITAADGLRFGIIDRVIPEPVPAHESFDQTIELVGKTLKEELDQLVEQFGLGALLQTDQLLEARYQKYRQIGAWVEAKTGEG